MVAPAIPLTHVGWKAEAALEIADNRAHVLTPLSKSAYLTAGGALIWLGPPGSVAHPRALVAAEAVRCIRGEPVALDLTAARRWPRAHGRPIANPSAVAAATRELLTTLRRHPGWAPTPLGFGTLLVGGDLRFPLSHAEATVVALARACHAGRVADAAAAAEQLLGLGPGLTPAGDDLVGGVLFARARLERAHLEGWRRAGRMLLERARQRTNPISHALLADLAAGDGYEPLHQLADVLERGADASGALDAVRRLADIGHSSGWDLLTGFLIGIDGRAALGHRS